MPRFEYAAFGRFSCHESAMEILTKNTPKIAKTTTLRLIFMSLDPYCLDSYVLSDTFAEDLRTLVDFCKKN